MGHTPTNILSLDAHTIRTQDLLTGHILEVSPSGQFYRDVDGILSSNRPSVRFRSSPVFFTYDALGGAVDRELPRVQDLGSDLAGCTFWDSDSPSEPQIHYTVDGPSTHTDDQGRTTAVLDYFATNNPSEIFQSTVREVRSWTDSYPTAPLSPISFPADPDLDESHFNISDDELSLDPVHDSLDTAPIPASPSNEDISPSSEPEDPVDLTSDPVSINVL